MTTCSSSIHILSHEFQKMKIQRVPREKKYLINSQTRCFLKKQSHIYIGIIPFRAINLPVYNPKKEFFLHQTEVITHHQNMLGFNILETHRKNMIELVLEWINKMLGLNLAANLLHKILDVENSKVVIYTLNLSKLSVLATSTNSTDSIVTQFQNLSLEKQLNSEYLKSKHLEIKKITDFYSKIEVKKTVRELYQNISGLKQNRSSLQKCIPFRINESHTIHLKYYGLYAKLA